MATERWVVAYLARAWSEPDKGRILRTLTWGDRVSYVERAGKNLVVDLTVYYREPDGGILARTSRGYIRHGGKATSKILGDTANDVLSVELVDVQQGDATVIRTPAGRVMFIDGGPNKLFARYLANRFRDTSPEAPLDVEAIVVSHGDADHFAGLPIIRESERDTRRGKSLFVRPRAIYHNGIVKRPKSAGTAKILGPTVKVDGETYLTGLVDDIRSLPKAQMNEPFKEWRDTIEAWATRAPVAVERLARGSTGAFQAFAAEGIDVEVLGPDVEHVTDPESGTQVPALRYLREPVAEPSTTKAKGSLSASHTINGHSIVLRLTYGKCRMLFAGDLNAEAERTLRRLHDEGAIDLESDVFKVPHHGSADFGDEFLEAVSPLVSVVSSGDESARTEYIHPRATLMGALGRRSRVDRPLVFVTELVAFFALEGFVGPDVSTMTATGRTLARRRGLQIANIDRKRFFSFSRAAYGTVRIRTDGRQLLVYTDSALVTLKEAYRLDLTVTPPTLHAVTPI